MNTITFKVQGSAREPYAVSFMRHEDNLTAHCTCPAGGVGQYCKHRLNILKGLTQGIVSGNEAEVATVDEWLKGTDVELALQRLHEAEQDPITAPDVLHKLKKKLAKALMD